MRHTHRILTVGAALRRLGHIALLTALPIVALQAQAQSVRKCQIDGRVVFQASPCPLEPRAAAASAPAAAPAAAPASSTNVAAGASAATTKKSQSDLVRERDAAARKPPASQSQGDGANVLPPRMGAL